MRYPLDHYLALPRGYTFGEPTSYSDFHLGEDLVVPIGTPLYAPTDGTITSRYVGPQGGNTALFLDSFGKLWRFLHLRDNAGPLGPVKEGAVIAHTGNTGSQTTGPHLHQDVSKNGKLELNNHANFIDPKNYLIEHMTSTYDNHIIRNSKTNESAYVARGKKQLFDNSNGVKALVAFLDRLPPKVYAQEYVVNVDQKTWDAIPTTTEFFPPIK